MITNRNHLSENERWDVVLEALNDGIAAAHPKTVIRRDIEYDGRTLTIANSTHDLDAYEDVYVVGGGNAAGAAATALEAILGDAITEGAIVTDETVNTDEIAVYEGSHPLPSREAVQGARAVFELANAVEENDLILAIVSGGGSAHLSLPVEGVSLADLRDVTGKLLESGVPIKSLNAVRKHLSRIKGGQLAAAADPASVSAIVFSDVVGDRLDTIASGPVSPDPTTFEMALNVARSIEDDVPESVTRHLERGVTGDEPETPNGDEPYFDAVETNVVANGRTAIDAATAVLSDHGYEPVVLSSRVRGEAQEIARDHVAIAEECHYSGVPFGPPVAVVSGGETTVTVRGDGTGGPNQEYVLSAAVELATSNVSDTDIVVGGVDTDGFDGATDAAGAIADESTVDDSDGARSRLSDNDACGYFSANDLLIRTDGDTGTNVNDLRVVLIE